MAIRSDNRKRNINIYSKRKRILEWFNMEPLCKSVYCSNKIIKIGVCSAIIAFNNGFYGLEKVFHKLHFLPGYFFGSGALKSNNKRVINSSRKASDATKKARKYLRAVRKGHLDMTAEKEEGESNKSGAF